MHLSHPRILLPLGLLSFSREAIYTFYILRVGDWLVLTDIIGAKSQARELGKAPQKNIED